MTIKEPGAEEESEEGVDNEKLAGKVDMLLEEYISSAELEEATSCLEELKAPEYYPCMKFYSAILM